MNANVLNLIITTNSWTLRLFVEINTFAIHYNIYFIQNDCLGSTKFVNYGV